MKKLSDAELKWLRVQSPQSESHTGETIAYAEGDEDVVQLIEVWTSGRRRKGVRFFHFRWLLGYTTLFGALLFGLLWMAIVAVPSIFGASILDPGGATYGLAGFSAAVSILIVGFAWRRCLAEGIFSSATIVPLSLDELRQRIITGFFKNLFQWWPW
jgi:hypothetical protein